MKNLFVNWNNIAHRGIHDNNIPENSLKAFKIAIKNNYAIEFDIHILRDNNIVVFHDDNLKRMTGINKKINYCTYEELKNINLLNSNQTIPLFNDVLNEINGQVPILIEIKKGNKIKKIIKEMFKQLENYNGTFYFQTFSFLTIIYFKIFKRKNRIGLLVSSKKNKIYYNFVKIFIKIFKPDFLSYPVKRNKDKILKKYKNSIIMWTIKNDRDYSISEKYAEKIIFEN